MYYMVPSRPKQFLNIPKAMEYHTLEYNYKKHVYQPPLTQMYFQPPPKIFYQPPPIKYDLITPPTIQNYYVPYQYITPPIHQSYVHWPYSYRIR